MFAQLGEFLASAQLLLLQFAATAAMTGLIWFVQIVHYPLFARVGREGFEAYERLHQDLTGLVVGPIMAVEMATAAVQLALSPGSASDPLVLTAFALLLLVWLSTALVQIPCHHRLAAGFDEAVHRRLVRSNWLRTFAWTTRTALVYAQLAA